MTQFKVFYSVIPPNVSAGWPGGTLEPVIPGMIPMTQMGAGKWHSDWPELKAARKAGDIHEGTFPYPELDRIEFTAPQILADHAYLDVEHLRFGFKSGYIEHREYNVGYLKYLLQSYKFFRPEVKLGVFRLIPDQLGARWWRTQSDGNSAWFRSMYPRWAEHNEYLKSVAHYADYIAPEFYAGFPTEDEYWDYVKLSIVEARRYGKPVYPFLHFRYTGGSGMKDLRGRELPTDFWRRQLEFCKEHADGCIVWGADFASLTGEPWEVELIDFVEALKLEAFTGSNP